LNVKRISAIALSCRDFDSFDEKLAEACRWVSLAARMGSRLAVLPEAINVYRGDGPGNPLAMTIAEAALDDWQSACQVLIDCAVENGIAVTVPVFVREGADFVNCSYLVSAQGEVLGRYAKMFPTQGEVAEGVRPGGEQDLIEWDGLRLGGAICFDMQFSEVYQRQAGADLLLCPSLCPGGGNVNYWARTLCMPMAVAYPAWSRIINVLGKEVAAGGYRHETLRFGFGVPVYTADVNFDTAVFHFDRNQDHIEAVLRRYGADVAIEFDQDNCLFSLESRSPELTIRQVAEEFGLQGKGAFLDESRHRVEG
jgi:predicted amidohydrolase